MALGDRREPVVLRWRDDGAVNEFGEPEDTDERLDTWGSLAEPYSVGRTVGALAVQERTGGAVVRIAGGGTVTPEANLAGLTCEVRGTVRVVERVTDSDGRRRWYNLHLSA